MRVLLVGSGGREHALAWKLAQVPGDELHAAPGSPGIARLGECHPIRAEDAEGMLALARALDVDLVVVGPEAPLVAGMADVLRHAGIAVFGPSAAAAAIEGSKTFAKEVMTDARVPTAASLAVARIPCVVKADGLAAGKGVHICRTQAELDAALAAVTAFGDRFVVEELLEGPEVSLFAICDGYEALALVPAQDFKRAYDGDEGPNTGGMGSYAPVPGFADALVEEVLETVHKPVLGELSRRGSPFVGLLYAGLMLTPDGVRVLEFNCRFGDPETQSVVPLVTGDLLDVLAAAAAGELRGVSLHGPSVRRSVDDAASATAPSQRGGEAGESSPESSTGGAGEAVPSTLAAAGTVGESEESAGGAAPPAAAVTVVLAAAGYPAGADRGSQIAGVDEAEAAGALVFHAATALRGDRLVTNGGRILGVTGLGDTVAAARAAAYAAADHIEFRGARRREDIALAAAEGQVFSMPQPRSNGRH
jgi:phosphoribosylamine--glycine ligase